MYHVKNVLISKCEIDNAKKISFFSGPRVNLAKLSQSPSNRHRNTGNLELVMTEDIDHHPIRT